MPLIIAPPNNKIFYFWTIIIEKMAFGKKSSGFSDFLVKYHSEIFIRVKRSVPYKFISETLCSLTFR